MKKIAKVLLTLLMIVGVFAPNTSINVLAEGEVTIKGDRSDENTSYYNIDGSGDIVYCFNFGKAYPTAYPGVTYSAPTTDENEIKGVFGSTANYTPTNENCVNYIRAILYYGYPNDAGSLLDQMATNDDLKTLTDEQKKDYFRWATQTLIWSYSNGEELLNDYESIDRAGKVTDENKLKVLRGLIIDKINESANLTTPFSNIPNDFMVQLYKPDDPSKQNMVKANKTTPKESGSEPTISEPEIISTSLDRNSATYDIRSGVVDITLQDTVVVNNLDSQKRYTIRSFVYNRYDIRQMVGSKDTDVPVNSTSFNSNIQISVPTSTLGTTTGNYTFSVYTELYEEGNNVAIAYHNPYLDETSETITITVTDSQNPNQPTIVESTVEYNGEKSTELEAVQATIDVKEDAALTFKDSFKLKNLEANHIYEVWAYLYDASKPYSVNDSIGSFQLYEIEGDANGEYQGEIEIETYSITKTGNYAVVLALKDVIDEFTSIEKARHNTNFSDLKEAITVQVIKDHVNTKVAVSKNAGDSLDQTGNYEPYNIILDKGESDIEINDVVDNIYYSELLAGSKYEVKSTLYSVEYNSDYTAINEKEIIKTVTNDNFTVDSTGQGQWEVSFGTVTLEPGMYSFKHEFKYIGTEPLPLIYSDLENFVHNDYFDANEQLYISPYIDLNIAKFWIDDSNAKGLRPSEIKFTLVNGDKKYEYTLTNATEREVRQENGEYEGVWFELRDASHPLLDENGDPIQYEVIEASVANYKCVTAQYVIEETPGGSYLGVVYIENEYVAPPTPRTPQRRVVNTSAK